MVNGRCQCLANAVHESLLIEPVVDVQVVRRPDKGVFTRQPSPDELHTGQSTVNQYIGNYRRYPSIPVMFFGDQKPPRPPRPMSQSLLIERRQRVTVENRHTDAFLL